MKFNSLSLSEPILKAVQKQGYETPSPIQQQAIPVVLKGKDLLAAAQTGTGKTAAFTLPILEVLSKKSDLKPNQARVLILTPTRELAAQVQANIQDYSEFLNIRSDVVFGGIKINPQMKRLRSGVDILVATPGRLLDLYNQNAIRFDSLEIFVLDEADRMLDMGFIRDIRKIMAFLPAKRQNLMFSATFTPEIRALAKTIVRDPVEISVSHNSTARLVTQMMHPVDRKKKAALLVHLIRENNWRQILVFSKTKHGANKLARTLEDTGIPTAAIHGNKSQGARTKALADFKEGAVRVLVATDIAARGLDIDQLPQVVNFDLPQVPEDYVHRIGRTGRAGASGHAYSLVAADEAKLLFDIERVIQEHIQREYVQGFVPDHDVPKSIPIQPKKRHRPKNRKEIGSSGDAVSPRGPSQVKSSSSRQPSQARAAAPSRGRGQARSAEHSRGAEQGKGAGPARSGRSTARRSPR